MACIHTLNHLSQLFRMEDIKDEDPQTRRFLRVQANTKRPRPRILFPNSQPSFTLRLEHREGGAVARSKGEERLLLFRSDRAGAIGKIIYSSTLAAQYTNKSSSSRANKKRKTSHLNTSVSGATSSYGFMEEELCCMAQAKVHVLDVKKEYRGMDLGGLLFAEAMRSLQTKYHFEPSSSPASSTSSRGFQNTSPRMKCELEAEEDLARHNKLIHFYEQLGCTIKPNSKTRILYNNDGTTYRKVPMQIALKCFNMNLSQDPVSQEADVSLKRKQDPVSSLPLLSSSLLTPQGNTKMFLPIHFLNLDGTHLTIPLRHHTKDSTKHYIRMNLLIVQEEYGLSFRSTKGHQIQEDRDGNMVAISTDDSDQESPSYHPLTCFQVSKAFYWSNGSTNFTRSDCDQCPTSDNVNCDKLEEETYEDGKFNDLWVVRSLNGKYIGVNHDTGSLTLSNHAEFWHTDRGSMSFICTHDTPFRRRHYMKSWEKQSMNYVMEMREKYFDFGLKQMTLYEALEQVKLLKCHPFWVTQDGPNLRTLLFQTAEFARKEGYPDWMQILCLIHGLGRVVSCIDETLSNESQDYNWTLTIRSRVLGCSPPTRANFGEFSHLDPDLSNEQANTPNGIYLEHCGMENLLLSWTGPEYMYFMLKHNGVSLPEEGFAALRLFQLGDWHTHDEYRHFSSEVDDSMKDFVTDFDKIRKCVRRECMDDLSDDECQFLWKEYYEQTAYKYDCGHLLSW